MFRIELSPITHGWITISLYNDKRLILKMNGSYAFNPFYEIPELISSLKNNKDYLWEIDQEGYLGIVTFIFDKNNLRISTIDEKAEYFNTSNYYNRDQVIEEFIEVFSKFYIENKNREEFEGFHFDEIAT